MIVVQIYLIAVSVFCGSVPVRMLIVCVYILGADVVSLLE